MADQAAVAPADATSTDATQAAQTTAVTPPADATGTNSGTSDAKFTQADLDRIVNERLERERTKSQKDAAKAQADAEAKVLTEQGKYKELFEKQQADLQAAQAEARQASIKVMQRDIASKTNLPLALAERLRGETLEEMEADAKNILAALPKPAAPNINASNGAGGAPAAGQLSEADKQRIADKYGVDPHYVQ